jgi:hypothetical protein
MSSQVYEPMWRARLHTSTTSTLQPPVPAVRAIDVNTLLATSWQRQAYVALRLLHMAATYVAAEGGQ